MSRIDSSLHRMTRMWFPPNQTQANLGIKRNVLLWPPFCCEEMKVIYFSLTELLVLSHRALHHFPLKEKWMSSPITMVLHLHHQHHLKPLSICYQACFRDAVILAWCNFPSFLTPVCTPARLITTKQMTTRQQKLCVPKLLSSPKLVILIILFFFF